MDERARFWTTPGFTNRIHALYERPILTKTQVHPDEDEVIGSRNVSREFCREPWCGPKSCALVHRCGANKPVSSSSSRKAHSSGSHHREACRQGSPATPALRRGGIVESESRPRATAVPRYTLLPDVQQSRANIHGPAGSMTRLPGPGYGCLCRRMLLLSSLASLIRCCASRTGLKARTNLSICFSVMMNGGSRRKTVS